MDNITLSTMFTGYTISPTDLESFKQKAKTYGYKKQDERLWNIMQALLHKPEYSLMKELQNKFYEVAEELNPQMK